MAKGISIHIGLNRVDPAHYEGWDGQLAACEADARDMNTIAKAKGYLAQQMLTEQATAENVTGALRKAARELDHGDMLFVTYSGHGGQVPDTNGDEPDGRDETWVLYDRQLIDDELYALFSEFDPGVRIFVLSDSCHSGSVVRELYNRMSAALGSAPAPAPIGPRFKALPLDVQERTYRANQKLYDDIQRYSPDGERVSVNASILLISGCQDNQLSSDGDKNGLFTATLLSVWNKGKLRNYGDLYAKIRRSMPPWQSPNFFRAGAADRAFERQKPLTIETRAATGRVG